MGNRVYFTLKTKEQTKTYYTHWNGGLDTFCPVFENVFKRDIKEVEKIEGFFNQLGIKLEAQTDKDASTWLEDNGHYHINLEDKTFIQKTERWGSKKTIIITDFRDAFEEYVKTYLKPGYLEESIKGYWDPVMLEATKFFDGVE